MAASASVILAETCQPGDSTPRFLAAQRSAVSSRREEIAQRKPFQGFPLDSFGNRGARPLCHPGVARHRRLPMERLHAFPRGKVASRSEVGLGSGSSIKPHYRIDGALRPSSASRWSVHSPEGKALERVYQPVAAPKPPTPTTPAPQGFLQSKNALRRTNAAKFAARQKDR